VNAELSVVRSSLVNRHFNAAKETVSHGYTASEDGCTLN